MKRDPLERAMITLGGIMGWLAERRLVPPPAMDWHGWAVPAILEVLTEYHCCCTCCPECHEHVAPLIADRIGCDPQRAIEALSTFRPDKVTP